jgi:pimeloyl-ACP methyl ester carboxylesterase
MNQTVVLIHGYGFDQRIWSPVELAFDRFQMVRLSLPGFGTSAEPVPYTIESLAHQYWSQLDAEGIDHVHLVGHSMGGYVCMEMAAQQPERILSLALIHSHVFKDTEEKQEQRSATIKDIEAHGRDVLIHKMIPSLFADPSGMKPLIDVLIARGMAYGNAAWMNGTRAIRDRKDHAETLKKIHVPVLMVMGEKDTAVPSVLGYKQAGISDQTKLIIYPDAGHMAMYENTSQLLCDLIVFYRSFI